MKSPKLVASTAVAAFAAVLLVGCPPKSTSAPPTPPAANPTPPPTDAAATKPPEPAASPVAPANPAPAASPATKPATDAGSSTAGMSSVPAGSIEGRITVNRAVTPPSPMAIDKDPEACGKTYDPASLVLSATKGLSNAVVYLKGELPAWKPDSSGRYQVDQKGCHYDARVTIVPVGSPVDFINSDGVLHNVSWNSPFNGGQNLAIPPHQRTSWTFKHADFIGMSCGVHPFMGGALVVAEHPWYTLTDANGNYRLANVPPGSYKLIVWHEVLKKAVNAGTPVTVEAGKTARQDVSYD